MKKQPYTITGMAEAEGVRVYAKENETGKHSFCVTDGVEFTFLTAEAMLEAVRDNHYKKSEPAAI